MSLLKIKEWLRGCFAPAPPPAPRTPVHELDAALLREVDAIAAKLRGQSVSVRDLLEGEVIPDEPQVDEGVVL